MGSVDIPPFLREQQKAKISEKSDSIPPFLKKKETETEEKNDGAGLQNVSGTLPTGTGSTPPSASPSPLDVEGIFSFNKGNKKTSIPANLPRTASEVNTVLAKVENGVVQKEDLSQLYNTDHGKPIVENLITTYAPELGKFGWDKEVFRNEEKWDELSRKIKVKNRTNATIRQEQAIKNIDADLQDAFTNLKTTKLTVTAGTGGGAVNENTIPIPVIDVNNPWEYGRVIEQLKNSDDVVGADGKRIPGKKEELIQALDAKAKWFTAKQGVDEGVRLLGDKITTAITRANMSREMGENIPVEEFAKNDKLNEEHFKIGLSYLKNVQPGQYKNIVRVIDEGKSLPDDDFRNIASVGQEIYNQQVFSGAATNPELIDKETNIDYTTRSDKKAEYAAIIGERLKSAGKTNRREFTEDEIKKAAYDLPNKTIVQELANEEKIFGYDAIPKSGAIEAIVQGIQQPLDGIKSTFLLASESPAETYIRSKKLDVGSGQKVSDTEGNISGVLPSDRGNIYYDALRGLGQFIPQVLLTKGIGGAATGVIGADARIALTPALKSGISAYGGTAISTFLQSYGDSYADYLQKTGDPATARLGATVDGGTAAAFELILPDVKIADRALSGLKSGLTTDIIDLVKKGGDPATLAKKARPFVQKFVTNTVNIAGQEIAEEDGTQLVDFITESIFSPQTAKDRDLGNELLETTKATAISMAIPSLLGGAGSSVNQDFTKSAFTSAAINFDDYRQALDKQLNNDAITQPEYNAAIKLLSTHKESINSAPQQNINGAPIDGQKQLDYAYEDTKIKVYKEKAANSEGVAKEMWENKIKQSEDIQREILMPKAAANVAVEISKPSVEDIPIDLQDVGEEIVSKEDASSRFSNGDRIFAFSEQDDQPIELFSVTDMDKYAPDQLLAYRKPNDLTPQDTIIKAVEDEVIVGPDAEVIKNGIATPDDILLSLAKQKYGVSDDGSIFPEGGRDISMKTSLDVDEAVEKTFPNQQSVISAIKNKQRNELITPILARINDADYINENELNGAADELYNALDDVEKDNAYTPEQKENARNLIEPIISKIEGYEFRTKTETRKVAETKATQIARPATQRKAVSKDLGQWQGNRADITDESGKTISGVLQEQDGKYYILNDNGEKVSVLGEKAITERDISLPSREQVPMPIEFDADGNVSGITLQLNKVDMTQGGLTPAKLITIHPTDKEKALDLAIQLRADEVGEISMEQFDTIYETIEKEVQEEVLVNQQNKPVTDGTQKTTTQTVQPATQGTTGTVKPTAQPETKQAAKAETTQPKKKVSAKVKSLTDELRSLLGNTPDEGLPFKEVSNKDIKEGNNENIEAYNQRAERVLKTLYPNAEFKAFSTTEEYEQETGRSGEAGLLVRGKDGKHKLFLNLEAIINSDIERTATHEVVHALVSDAIGAKYVDLRKKWDSLLPKLYNVKGFEIVKEHIEKYASADRPVEGITDLLANIVHDKIKIEDIPKNLWDEFIEFLNRAFEAIGLDYKVTPDTFNGFASSVKEAFETGDFTSLKKFTAKSKTEKFFKENPQFAESALAMVDPEGRKQVINDFVKSAFDRGESEADIKESLINNGISESDAQGFIDSNKPKLKTNQVSTKSENEVISTVLNQRIDARSFPSIFQENETGQQIAASTQGAGQQREVDGAYVVALESDLREVSIQSAKILRDELGADWGIKTLSWIEQNQAQGNIAQVVGLLNIISTENYQDIQNTHDGNKVRQLSAIQRRIDVVSLQRARDASLALRQRILYAQFAQGGNMTDVVAQSILSPEMLQMQSDLNEILSEQITDEEINLAPPLKTTKPKKTSSIRSVIGAAKRKSNPAIKDELITKGAEAANKTKKSFKELIEDAKNKLKNTKC